MADTGEPSLLEALLYGFCCYVTLMDHLGVFIPPEAERWLRGRTLSTDTAQLFHAKAQPQRSSGMLV